MLVPRAEDEGEELLGWHQMEMAADGGVRALGLDLCLSGPDLG
jgi:hypothetical protein